VRLPVTRFYYIWSRSNKIASIESPPCAPFFLVEKKKKKVRQMPWAYGGQLSMKLFCVYDFYLLFASASPSTST
jgi:hypothetical protein